MAWAEDLTGELETVLKTKWNDRDGIIVPKTQDVALKDGAVKIDATFLYADLAGSSMIAQLCPWETTAKIIRAYLNCCTRIIRAYDGHIRSFDGDRVLGIFLKDAKNTDASKCAREIFWMVEHVLNPLAKINFKSVRENGIYIKHCIGIDTGQVRTVRTGIRNNNDLIWIGKAPSFAAKLSDLRNYPYSTYISKKCYENMLPEGRIVNGISIWEIDKLQFAGKEETIYKSRYYSKP